MEQSDIQGMTLHRYELMPDFATLNPGYARGSSCLNSTSLRHARACSQACAGCINLPARASTSFPGAS